MIPAEEICGDFFCRDLRGRKSRLINKIAIILSELPRRGIILEAGTRQTLFQIVFIYSQ